MQNTENVFVNHLYKKYTLGVNAKTKMCIDHLDKKGWQKNVFSFIPQWIGSTLIIINQTVHCTFLKLKYVYHFSPLYICMICFGTVIGQCIFSISTWSLFTDNSWTASSWKLYISCLGYCWFLQKKKCTGLI